MIIDRDSSTVFESDHSFFAIDNKFDRDGDLIVFVGEAEEDAARHWFYIDRKQAGNIRYHLDVLLADGKPAQEPLTAPSGPELMVPMGMKDILLMAATTVKTATEHYEPTLEEVIDQVLRVAKFILEGEE